jgi:hypothetical protein
MTRNVIDLMSMDSSMDNIDAIFSKILLQVKKQEDAVLVADMLENNIVTFIKQCGVLLPAERLRCLKKKIKKSIEKAQNKDNY